MRKVKTSDILWLAGYLEGEGWFGYHEGVRLGATTTDKDIGRRTASILGCNLYGPYQRKVKKGEGNRKPHYQTILVGRRAAGWAMTLYCLMGKRRKKQIRMILKLFRKRFRGIHVKPSRRLLQYYRKRKSS